MSDSQPNNPLHGVTLEAMLTELVQRYGWIEMGRRINIRCFNSDPTIQSSLTFLRKTPWARQKVEDLYLRGGLGGRPGHKTKRRRPGTHTTETHAKKTRGASRM